MMRYVTFYRAGDEAKAVFLLTKRLRTWRELVAKWRNQFLLIEALSLRKRKPLPSKETAFSRFFGMISALWKGRDIPCA
jgi:hypothetical protein